MKEKLSESSFMYKVLKTKFPKGLLFEQQYFEGGYYDRSYTEYYVDGKVVEEQRSIGYYQ